jgi:hypothetical protein
MTVNTKGISLGTVEISSVQKSLVLTQLMHAACVLNDFFKAFVPPKWAHFQDRILRLHTGVECHITQHAQYPC